MADFNVSEQLDKIENNVMSGLKEFQRATVNRIDYLFSNEECKRVLVSDEVGLGKTLIARGVIAKFAKMRKSQGDNLVKVVYVCSNAAIADQNLRKLKVSKNVRQEQSGASRLSMQHLFIFSQEHDEKLLNQYIQLIPLTPETSFRMTTGAGTYSERALMFSIMKRLPELEEHVFALETAMIGEATSGWSWASPYYENEVVKCNEKSGGKYLSYMLKALSLELSCKATEEQTYLELIIEMCEFVEKKGYDSKTCYPIISKLRFIFAKISLDKLDPDLVIMDEFQRFNYLINSANGDSAGNESELGMLTKKFFNSETVRMLLLSATPYKMYSTLEEIDETQEDEHFTEFFNVMEFLNVTEEEHERFKTVWNDYSVHLKELAKGDTVFLAAKTAAEDSLYRHICRTERITAAESADIIDDKDVRIPLSVTEQDIEGYLQLHEILDGMEKPCSLPVDYVKSAPYLLSFMKDYQLKKQIDEHFRKNPSEVNKANKEALWLNKKTINSYKEIPYGNARLLRVLKHTFKNNAEKLLWVPPSKPYYPLQGAFENAGNFSKTLVFSTWEMVPKMIAGLLSYEAERLTIGEIAKTDGDREAHYFHDAKKRYPAALLNFSERKGVPAAMNLITLIYPSQFLTKCYDPVEHLNKSSTLEEIEEDIREKILKKLEKLPDVDFGDEDNRWYYMAPLLFDGAGYVTGWLNSDSNLTAVEGDDDDTKLKKGFAAHLKRLKELYRESHYGRTCNLGKRPSDLVKVLTDMAIASPAVVINRTYNKYCKRGKSFPSYLPTQIARIFINRMNRPEATAVIKLASIEKEDDEAHWKDLLTYCKDGNIQAMFDEYAHLTANGLDSDEGLINGIHNEFADSMNIKTTIYNVESFNEFKDRINNITKTKENKLSLRSHFAVAFIKGENKESDADRKKKVRNAFNSPFRPFVLASTSIGQEGLDFHNYCRRIVHWNLPSNPIDLEQREGRINRFECLAIRQNVAKRYGNISFKNDVWKEMFEVASKEETGGKGSELIPFWGLTPREDMIKIERIVPMYPFSRDGTAYKRLIKILSLYRLTLGQARQEELLEYLFQNCDDDKVEIMKKLFINLSPYYKNQ